MFSGRYEFKYRMVPSTAERLSARIARFMSHDVHTPEGSDPRYLVRSLYFDTRELSFYRDKTAGLRRRLKIRLRTYGDDPTSPGFLEAKRKDGPVVTKARAKLPAECAAGERGDRILDWVRRAGDLSLPDDLRRACDWPGLRPVLQVCYWREAWVDPRGLPLRITFDHAVSGRIASSLVPYQGGFRHRPALKGAVVMELKYSTVLPRWLDDLIVGAALRCEATSKYSLAMDAAAPGDCRRSLGVVDEGLSNGTIHSVGFGPMWSGGT